MDGEQARAAGGIAVFMMALGIGIAITLAINIVICYLVSDCYRRLPPQFRQMEPKMVWLLLIPLFNLFWNFMVFPKLSASYQQYFHSIGRTDVGDCYANMALALCICAACSVIPCVGMFAGIAALVVLILYLIKIHELKKQIPTTPAAPG